MSGSEEQATLDLLAERFPLTVIEHQATEVGLTLIIRNNEISRLFNALKFDKEFDFNILIDMTAIDYGDRSPRYEMVYTLHSIKFDKRLWVKVPVEEDQGILDSLSSLWPVADWYEREIYDMFGLVFKGHPFLRRILLGEGFEGHPLRKDYR